MFNPFKKKKDNFSDRLPSLSDIDKTNELTNDSLPTLSDSGLDLQTETLNQTPFPNNNLNTNLSNTSDNLNNFSQNNQSYNSTPTYSENPLNPMLNPNFSTQSNENNTNNNLIQSNDLELLKTQTEMLNSKITLILEKQKTIDSKLNLIYQILLEEISDETKQKLAIKSYLQKE